MENFDSSMMARGRLAVLSAHFSAESSKVPQLLETSCVSAQSRVPPPDNLKGLLTIVDERSGQRYKVEVSEDGTVKATDLKKVRTLIKTYSFFGLFEFYSFPLYIWIGRLVWKVCLFLGRLSVVSTQNNGRNKKPKLS